MRGRHLVRVVRAARDGHRGAGLSAGTLFKKAIQIALEKHDQKALAAITRAAIAYGDKELARFARIISQTGAGTRAVRTS